MIVFLLNSHKTQEKFLKTFISNFLIFYPEFNYAIVNSRGKVIYDYNQISENYNEGGVKKYKLSFVKILSNILKYTFFYFKALNVFFKLKPSKIITFSERSKGFIQIFMSIAYRQKNTEILYHEISFVPNEFIVKQKEINGGFDSSSITYKFSKLFYKNNIYLSDRNCEYYCFYGINEIIALKLTFSLPKNPWLEGENFADYILVINNDSYTSFKNHITKVDKLRLVGSPEYQSIKMIQTNHDSWFEKLNTIEKNILDTSEFIYCFGLPQLYEHKFCSFEQAKSLIENILEYFENNKKSKLICCLHPKMEYKNYSWINDYKNCYLSTSKLNTIIPFSDIYISPFKSTIFWAKILNKIPIQPAYFPNSVLDKTSIKINFPDEIDSKFRSIENSFEKEKMKFSNEFSDISKLSSHAENIYRILY